MANLLSPAEAAKDALRRLAQQAQEVAALIEQPDYPYNSFGTAPRVDMRTRGPDMGLKNIESALYALMAAINAHLNSEPR